MADCRSRLVALLPNALELRMSVQSDLLPSPPDPLEVAIAVRIGNVLRGANRASGSRSTVFAKIAPAWGFRFAPRRTSDCGATTKPSKGVARKMGDVPVYTMRSWPGGPK